MATILEGISRTFSEYLLLPNLTERQHRPENVSLSVPLVAFARGEPSPLNLNVPFVSAIMQAVSDDRLAIALARQGGLAFIFCSQTVEEQVEMVQRVKKYKAGFVTSDSNLPPQATLSDAVRLADETGHSLIAITEDGSPHGLLVGMLCVSDLRKDHLNPQAKLSTLMQPVATITVGRDGLSLKEANDLIWDKKLNCLPIVDAAGRLVSLVFRKDYEQHKLNPLENVDAHKRLCVGAGINTRDFEVRVPALVEAGADVLCLDSSDGFSAYQAEAIAFARKKFGNEVKIGAGNVVDAEGFDYLAAAGADFIKVGIGGGSICITREQKGIGRGQASAVLEVAEARDRWLARTGKYIPLCSDGGIVQDYHITLALAMGADFVMMGRYFARFDESPSRKIRTRSGIVKEYWGEGANRARNWQRYDMGGKNSLAFEEGVDCYVPYAGPLADGLAVSVAKIKSTFCNCGVLSIPELRQRARLTVISQMSLREGGAHDITLRETEMNG